MSPPQAKVKQRKISAIWFVPLLAVGVGGWMLVNHFLSQGPEIRISLENAEGIVAGKTKIKSLSVDIGIVESVTFNRDFSGVEIAARIEKEAAPLLREDSQLWVVRPRIGATGISGINTLLSGIHIELSPGEGRPGKRFFDGMMDIPVTPGTANGKRITLVSELVGSLTNADPVSYRGYRVGRIESVDFDTVENQFHYQVFIESPYDKLLNSSMRFWKASGVTVQADTEGLAVNTESLEAVISGGVAFDLPDRSRPGEPVENGYEYELFSSRREAEEQPFIHYTQYLLLFNESVRGLERGAPVEYRGMQVGSVSDVSFEYLPEEVTLASEQIPVPVLIRLDAARLGWEDTAESRQLLETDVVKRVDAGLRGSLATANLLTGSLYVSFDFFEDAETDHVRVLGDYLALPTISVGLSEIERKIGKILNTFEELPIEESVAEARQAVSQLQITLRSADETFNRLNKMLSDESVAKLPASLTDSIEQLKVALQGFSPDAKLYQDIGDSMERLKAAIDAFEGFANKIENRPSSLIFSKSAKKDPEPKKPSQ